MTEVQAVEDISLGFGIADMAYLLQLQNTQASITSAAMLRLGDEAKEAGLARAGLSSLIARGLAKVAPDSAVSFDPRIDVVAYTVANAVRWTQLDLLQSAEVGDTVLQIESDKTRLLLQPRTMLTWFAVPQDPVVSPEAAGSYVIAQHLLEHPDGGVRIRTTGPAGSAELLVRRDEDHWVYAPLDGDVVGTQAIAADEAGLTGALRELRATTGNAAHGE